MWKGRAACGAGQRDGRRWGRAGAAPRPGCCLSQRRWPGATLRHAACLTSIDGAARRFVQILSCLSLSALSLPLPGPGRAHHLRDSAYWKHDSAKPRIDSSVLYIPRPTPAPAAEWAWWGQQGWDLASRRRRAGGCIGLLSPVNDALAGARGTGRKGLAPPLKS